MRDVACAVAISSCSADGGSSGSRRLDGKPPLALAEEREVLSEIPMAPGRWAAACGPLGLLPSCTGTMSNSCSSLGVAAAGASPCVAAEGAVAKAAPEAEEGAVPVTASCATPPPVAIAGPVSAAESDQSADGSLPSAPLNPRCTGDAASTPGSTRSAVEAAEIARTSRRSLSEDGGRMSVENESARVRRTCHGKRAPTRTSPLAAAPSLISRAVDSSCSVVSIANQGRP